MEQELAMANHVYELVIDFLVNYSFQIAGAVIILIAGVLIGSWVARVLLRIQERRDVDVTLRKFIASTAKLLVVGMFVIIALSKLGISITPLIAAVGGLAVGASFAIQGPVSNYGAGLVIILTRMFKVGDTISVQGCSGVVTSIELATTHLSAEDGEDIIIPNKHIVGEIHRNSYANRMVEGQITIDAHADALKASASIRDVIKSTEGVPEGTRPIVGIQAFSNIGIIIGYRYWAPTDNYFEVLYRVNDRVYKALSDADIDLAIQHHQIRVDNPANAPA